MRAINDHILASSALIFVMNFRTTSLLAPEDFYDILYKYN